MKQRIADGSVGFPHVRVGHRQALKLKRLTPKGVGLFNLGYGVLLSLPRSAQRCHVTGDAPKVPARGAAGVPKGSRAPLST